MPSCDLWRRAREHRPDGCGVCRSARQPVSAERAAGIVDTYFGAVQAQTRALGLPTTFADDLLTAVQGRYAVTRVKDNAAFFQLSVQRL